MGSGYSGKTAAELGPWLFEGARLRSDERRPVDGLEVTGDHAPLEKFLAAVRF
ncbi:hypothetical protein [Lentzea guizhouensis]|uniref:hypothetical protein n=1 Tax=Lentzea guizhouensis TaxID=1586287 RepID=UPI0012B68EE9|nr:hypothetical protein [Lentzea guizhouensis]